MHRHNNGLKTVLLLGGLWAVLLASGLVGIALHTPDLQLGRRISRTAVGIATVAGASDWRWFMIVSCLLHTSQRVMSEA